MTIPGAEQKLSIDLDAKQPGSDAPVKASLVVEFYDYNKPLDLEVPPADQVIDAATLKKLHEPVAAFPSHSGV